MDSMWVEIDHSNFSSNNWRALQCFDPAIDAVNMSCCHGLSHIANEGNCVGGNIMIINTHRESNICHKHPNNNSEHLDYTWRQFGYSAGFQ